MEGFSTHQSRLPIRSRNPGMARVMIIPDRLRPADNVIGNRG
jgi:hypothetical protein